MFRRAFDYVFSYIVSVFVCVCVFVDKWAAPRKNLSSEFANRYDSNRSAQRHKRHIARVLKFRI